MSSQAVSVDEQLSSERKRQQQENRKKLIPSVKGIIFCGKQGIPLRGKTDSGRIHVKPESEQPLQNEGNFRALLRYAAESGDKDLSEHLVTSQKNALYTGPQIQNEIIDICGEIIQHKIINEVKEANFFSILADETTDIARMEQVSLCLRYVDLKDAKEHKVKEMFFEYIPTVDVTGSGLANLIITALKKHGLDCSHVVGQGYDGAAAMSGHCSAHSLNLAIADSCSQADVRNCVGIVRSVGSYFRHSAQRTAVLKEKIRDLLPAEHQKSLLAMCETRWVHKHEAVIRFKEIYSAIVIALEELQSSHNKETSQQAVQMLIERFTKHRKVVSALSRVLPSNFATSCEIDEAFCIYSAVLPENSTSVVKAELEVWKAAMTLTSPIPKSALECLDNCDQKLYPNIYTLLQILATIPVSTATPERTFSSLRRLKNYLRNTTSENRLNGLALMFLH